LKLSPPIEAANIRALLLDIEGTTTPIEFVFKTLFPFVSDRAEDIGVAEAFVRGGFTK